MQLIIKEDKLRKYRDHIQVGSSLSEKDKELFDRYFFAFTNLLDGLSERKVVELLMNAPDPLGQIGQSQAYNVVNGAMEIFGSLNINSAKKTAQKYIYATRLEEIAQKLEEMARHMINSNIERLDDGNGNIVERLSPEVEKEAGVLMGKAADVLMKAAKIHGLMEKEKVENPNKFIVAPNIIFTDDIAALDIVREINDTEFEDVTGNGGETEEGETETAGSES